MHDPFIPFSTGCSFYARMLHSHRRHIDLSGSDRLLTDVPLKIAINPIRTFVIALEHFPGMSRLRMPSSAALYVKRVGNPGLISQLTQRHLRW